MQTDGRLASLPRRLPGLTNDPIHKESLPVTPLERLRDFYEYEKDCNQKVLQMFNSVPVQNRMAADSTIEATNPSDPHSEQYCANFQKAIDKFTHAVTCRKLWSYRLQYIELPPASIFPNGMALDQIEDLLKSVYGKWDQLMSDLTDQKIDQQITYTSTDGPQHSDRLADILFHLHGHMMYHRGQVATLVHMCGGQAVDTDYFFWIHR